MVRHLRDAAENLQQMFSSLGALSQGNSLHSTFTTAIIARPAALSRGKILPHPGRKAKNKARPLTVWIGVNGQEMQIVFLYRLWYNFLKYTSEELFIVVVSGKSVFHNSGGAIVFWELRIRPGEDERKVYAEGEEYGIICKAQDLQGIVERLDKYIKKTKVRGAGLVKNIGCSHLVDHGEKWYEWSAGFSCAKEGRLSNEQGRLWYFELLPNRHYQIDQDAAEEVYEFPERKDIIYYFVLVKYYWYYEENGMIVYTGSDEARKEREAFFQGLFDCIGFPVETLYTYPKDGRTLFSK